MNDLEYVRARVADYQEYAQERTRHDSDMRIRAFVGERLSAARLRLAGGLDAATEKVLDDVLLRCIFADQVFVRKFEHARLDAAMIAALVRSDRQLLELAQSVAEAGAADLRPIVIEIDKQFEYRRAPEPVYA